MKFFTLTAAALAASVSVTAAQAADTVVLASELANPNVNLGPMYNVTTTTDATGRRTTASSSFGVRYTGARTPDTWQQQNIGGGATVGITTDYARNGNGSLYFSGTGTAAKADAEIFFGQAIPLSQLTALSYDAYRDASSTAPAHLVNSLRFMVGNAAGVFTNTYLIFEPVYNGFPTAAPIAEDTWHTFNVTGSSRLFANNGALVEPGAGACPACYFTLDQWKASNANSTIVGLSTGSGSGWSGSYTGAVDNISFTANGVTTRYNFEVTAAAQVPEPATWAMMILGFGAAGSVLRRRRTAVLAA